MDAQGRTQGRGRQGYSSRNRTVRKRMGGPSARELIAARHLIEQGIPPTCVAEWFAIVRLITNYERSRLPDSRRKGRKCVNRGDGQKESFVGKVYIRGGRPSPKSQK